MLAKIGDICVWLGGKDVCKRVYIHVGVCGLFFVLGPEVPWKVPVGKAEIGDVGVFFLICSVLVCAE